MSKPNKSLIRIYTSLNPSSNKITSLWKQMKSPITKMKVLKEAELTNSSLRMIVEHSSLRVHLKSNKITTTLMPIKHRINLSLLTLINRIKEEI